MIAVVQRSGPARVTVAGEVVGAIDHGFVVLVGVGRGDTETESEYLARRIQELRVFEDAEGRMNRSVLDVSGAVLAVPQFTLLAGLRKGRRPDFLAAAEPAEAQRLFGHFVDQLRGREVSVETGRFGATMQVHLVNEGPATFVLDTTRLLETPRSSRDLGA